MRTVTALELETDPGRVTSVKLVPVTLKATCVSGPEPALTNTFTPVTAGLAFHATRREPLFVAREPPTGFIRTRSFEAIVKVGPSPNTPSEAPLESVHTAWT